MAITMTDLETLTKQGFSLKISKDSEDYLLEATITLPVRIEEAFEFFKDPRNLSKITPAWLDFRMVVQDNRVYEGAEFDYFIRWSALRLRWRSRIINYRPPYEFTDIQLKGPYLKWHHYHSFKDLQGKTLMYDRVSYRLPFGFIGRFTHQLIVKNQLIDIFSYRAKTISKHFASLKTA